MHRWARALKKYKKGVELIENDDQFSPEEKKWSADIKKSCNLNLAATYLKVNDSKEARKACNKVSLTCLRMRILRGLPRCHATVDTTNSGDTTSVSVGKVHLVLTSLQWSTIHST